MELVENFSVVRTFNVEKLNDILQSRSRVVCKDSKFSKPIEIRFSSEKSPSMEDTFSLIRLLIGREDVSDSAKLSLIGELVLKRSTHDPR